MMRTRHNKKISLLGLLLLTVFVNLYLVQLVCDLPHLAQLLQPVNSTAAHHHGTGHGEHSHTHGGPSSSKSHGDEHTHHEEKHPASPTQDAGCCAEQASAPFVKASPSGELPSLAKSPVAFTSSLYQAVLSLLYKGHITEVSHAPPDAPVPKIPDIRIFLHSLII